MFPECKLFRDIALQRSLSRAAAANGISQPAATQQIRELERRLGTALLDRSRRPLELTEAGKVYLEFCRDIVRRAEEFEAALDRHRAAAIPGDLRVASIYSVALTEMTRVRSEFTSACPSIELKVEYLRPDKVYEAVLNESADFGLVSYPEPSRQLAVIPWREERMAVALPPTHRYHGRTTLRAQDLEGENFVAFDPDLAIRKHLDRFFKEQGVEVQIAMHFDNIQMVKEAVALGHGVSILPDRTMRNEIEQGRLKRVRLNAPGLVRPVGVVHRKRKSFSRAAMAFLEALPAKPAI
jgi:DNA-binding transcriptional LysR family regulator